MRLSSLTRTLSLSGQTTDLAIRTELCVLSWGKGSINQVSELDASWAVATSLKAGILTVSDITTPMACKAAGAGQVGQAKTGPLFSALGLVMIVNCIDRMVKIVT